MKDWFKINRNWGGEPDQRSDREDKELFDELIIKLQDKSFFKEKKIQIKKTGNQSLSLNCDIILENILLSLRISTKKIFLKKKYDVVLSLIIKDGINKIGGDFHPDEEDGLVETFSNLHSVLNLILKKAYLLKSKLLENENPKDTELKIKKEIKEDTGYISYN